MAESVWKDIDGMLDSFKRLEALTAEFQGHIASAKEIQNKLLVAGKDPAQLVFVMHPDDAAVVHSQLGSSSIMGIPIEPSLHVRPGNIYICEKYEISPEG